MLELLFPYILTLHVGTVFIILALHMLADFYALAWVRGTRPLLEYATIHRIHTLMWCCLIGMIITGGLLFYPYQDFLSTLIFFRVKMVFVTLLILNSFFIGTTLRFSSEKLFSALSRAQKTSLLVSGALSALCWIGAITMGMLLGL